MKKLLFLSMLLGAFAACDPGTPVEKGKDPLDQNFVLVRESSYGYDGEAQTASIDVVSSFEPVAEITYSGTDGGWLQVEVSKWVDPDCTFKLTLAANYTDAVRSATIDFKNADGRSYASTVITQQAGTPPPTFWVNGVEGEYTYNYEPESYVLDIESNVDLRYSTSYVPGSPSGWLAVKLEKDASSEFGYKVTLTTELNVSPSERKATIKFNNPNGDTYAETLVIQQPVQANEKFVIAEPSYTYGFAYKTVEIKFNANVYFTVEFSYDDLENADWLSSAPVRSSETSYTLAFTFQPNLSGVDRNATVKFMDADGVTVIGQTQIIQTADPEPEVLFTYIGANPIVLAKGSGALHKQATITLKDPNTTLSAPSGFVDGCMAHLMKPSPPISDYVYEVGATALLSGVGPWSYVITATARGITYNYTVNVVRAE